MLQKKKIFWISIAIIIMSVLSLCFYNSVEATEMGQKELESNAIDLKQKESGVEVFYDYKEETNTVIAKIVSDTELQDTKVSWTLSEDKKEYTFEFNANTTYTTTVIDIYGRVIEVKIEVTEVKDAQINVFYEYKEETNTVIAKIVSDTELQDTKVSWTLSENKKEYSFEFNTNTTYTTTVVDVRGRVKEVKIEVTEVKDAKIEVFYEYKEDTNTVIAKIVADTELQDTKVSWTLSEDKKEYSFEFNANTTYTTTVVDVRGRVREVEIKVVEVIETHIDVDYDYNDETNRVLVTLTSNVELKDTKKSWQLSEDRKKYTFEFSDNTTYETTLTDIYGREIKVNIEVVQVDKTPPKITLEYRYEGNNIARITMKSNEKLARTKPTWTFSEDDKSCTKLFPNNENYTTSVQDIYGNAIDVYIRLEKKEEMFRIADNSLITVGYMYTSYNSVIVTMISEVPFKDTKPSWKLEEGGYRYIATFYNDQKYTTPIVNINGTTANIPISVDFFFKIIQEIGVYGYSGAIIQGVPGGLNLEYLRFGNGKNVMFATFCVHGFEDSWARDGESLVTVANNFYTRLVSDHDEELAKKWTIYIMREVNPDGRRLGYTNNGPGRTTVYSSIGRGIDINRSWQTGSSYKRYTDNRNYNGTAGFQAYEASYLRDFLLSHKSQGGQTVLVDLHGWENQLIGDAEICNYYKAQYPSCSTRSYGSYGTQYLISWARQNLGARSALIELPMVNSMAEFNSQGFSNKYINATLNMLRGL